MVERKLNRINKLFEKFLGDGRHVLALIEK
jgi:hypothetical protein